MYLRSRTLWRVLAASLLAVGVLGLALVGTAWAAPSDPTLGLTALKAKLDASPSGSIDGYFKTVDHGSTIETIPVTILSITGGSSASSALILFEATGAQIDKFGGIVAGMSGSPVYVTDAGVDKVVGAVSYGDYFTKGGTGLATPIESMLQVQSSYAPTFVSLPKPVITTDGVVKNIVISPSPQSFSAASKVGTYVAAPLASVFIGGLDPNSLGYKLAAKDLANHGVSTVTLAGPLAPGVGDQGFTTPLVPGAAIAALQSRGDMWVGGVGTLTYTDGANALAFGHPAYFTGPTSLYLTNAWIDGVWPSTYEPYKLARVGALRGTFTQDRTAGILGSIGTYADETTFTATVTDGDRSTVSTSAVYMPRALVDSGTIDPIMSALALYPAGEQVEDAQATPGSAEITTTIVATDGTDVYTITMPNLVDDSSDVVLEVIQDAATAINELQAVPTDGVHQMQLLSVDMQAKFIRAHRSAKIVGVKLPQPLHAGANRVDVQLLVYGVAATQTVSTTLTVPAKSSLTGDIFAYSQSAERNSGVDDFMSIGVSTSNMGQGVSITIPSSPKRRSLADAAHDLGGQLPNSVIGVDFVPTTDNSDNSFDPSELMYGGLPDPAGASALTTVSTPWAVTSAAYVVPTRLLVASFSGSTIGYQGYAYLIGELDGPSSVATVGVYATPAGGTERLVRTVTLNSSDSGTEFFVQVGGFSANTTYRFYYAGSDTIAPAEASILIKVRASVHVAASKSNVTAGSKITLTSNAWSAGTVGGNVVFEYNDHGNHWRAIATKTLALVGGKATATTSFTPPVGSHKVRARFLGSSSNAPGTSASIKVAAH